MLIDDILQYFQENFSQYLIYVYQHLGLSIQAIGISCLIGIPLGYISHKHRKLSQMITLSSQALRIIPSLAVLFLLISLIGVGRAPALIALVLLGIPPILVNTTVGFLEVPAVMIETGKGLGMTDRELLKRVKIPMAFPFVMTGVKLALVEIISSATLATYIGAGGLGTLIFTGLGLNRMDLLLIGGVSVAMIAFTTSIFLDYIIKRSIN
ncbi:MAG TPA: ABC transporter permease [Trichococcus flocculiformis]|uniref:ABC transporter permease n=1 Tax=Trichococcus flocculiformis TaxID=82803 RepID=UPI002BAA0683|nr:ABC transporter permease [Trichococcus flocculiformis]